jgi:hypothetical protein
MPVAYLPISGTRDTKKSEHLPSTNMRCKIMAPSRRGFSFAGACFRLAPLGD